jgi:DNA invertase Pin-like site-specific DNA recombinase
MNLNYVAYYRVSTKMQGNSGLGIEAQKKAVADFVRNGKLLQEFTEIESGKNNNRFELQKALEFAKENSATLIIAKLDRLSRNIGFIFALKDSGVNFIACDLPEMNTLNLGIFATIAQHERELTSKRTRDALQAKKAQGFKLGKPENLNKIAIEKGKKIRIENARKNSNNLKAFLVIQSLKKEKLSYAKIATKLNEHGFKTRRNRFFKPMTVKRLYNNLSSLPAIVEAM